MYSVEFEHDDITITVLDESGVYEDLIVIIKDDVVLLEQAELLHNIEICNTMVLTYDMLKDLLAAYNSPEGFYQRRHKKT